MVVNSDMDVGELYDTMKTEWNMDTPNLLISVTGGAKKFRMTSELRDGFRQGLVKAAESTGKPIYSAVAAYGQPFFVCCLKI